VIKGRGIMTERELLELIATKVANIDSDLLEIKTEIKDVKTEIKEVKKTVIKIEHEHGQKLEALFDGYKQYSDQLERIESEVAKHDEFILKRVK
jgi:archaellum component FlaC